MIKTVFARLQGPAFRNMHRVKKQLAPNHSLLLQQRSNPPRRRAVGDIDERFCTWPKRGQNAVRDRRNRNKNNEKEKLLHRKTAPSQLDSILNFIDANYFWRNRWSLHCFLLAVR